MVKAQQAVSEAERVASAARGDPVCYLMRTPRSKEDPYWHVCTVVFVPGIQPPDLLRLAYSRQYLLAFAKHFDLENYKIEALVGGAGRSTYKIPTEDGHVSVASEWTFDLQAFKDSVKITYSSPIPFHFYYEGDCEPYQGGTLERGTLRLSRGPSQLAEYLQRRQSDTREWLTWLQENYGSSPALASDHKPPLLDRREECWAVVIGISDYLFAGQAGLARLAFADKDARDFAETLERLGWSGNNIRVLVNDEATKRNVSYALETWLRRAGPEDMIVLFWSAHCWPDPSDPEKAFFACYDSKPSDPSSGFRMDQVRRVLAERNARNVVTIADTCHSGKVIRTGDARAIAVRPALDAMKRTGQIPKGWVFIASADPDRKAYEDMAWSNGALTHVLLEGLREGKADGYQSVGLKDGVVTLAELRAYISERMREESLRILGARLDPLFYTTSGDPDIWKLSLMVR